MSNYIISNGIYYGSYLVFPFLGIVVWFYYRRTLRLVMIVLGFLSVLFIYARFIEPYLIFVHEYKIQTFTSNQNESSNDAGEIKIAVFSDPHLGLYKHQDFLKRVVEKVNEQKPDVVLIPGDFTYEISPEELTQIFAPLREIEAPVFAVTGNHDAEKPGEYPSQVVRAAVSPHDVQVVDNQKATIEVKGHKINIIGLSDIWEGKTDYSLLENVKPEDNTIVLVHNPDASYNFPNANVDLAVAGHTHGGQIRLPFIYKFAIPTQHDFDQGLYDVKGVKVFVTSGVGEVGLPMRFLVPPEIAVLKLKAK